MSRQSLAPEAITQDNRVVHPCYPEPLSDVTKRCFADEDFMADKTPNSPYLSGQLGGNAATANSLEMKLHNAYARHQCFVRAAEFAGKESFDRPVKSDGSAYERGEDVDDGDPLDGGDDIQSGKFLSTQLLECQLDGVKRVTDAGRAWLERATPQSVKPWQLDCRQAKLKCIFTRNGWCGGTGLAGDACSSSEGTAAVMSTTKYEDTVATLVETLKEMKSTAWDVTNKMACKLFDPDYEDPDDTTSSSGKKGGSKRRLAALPEQPWLSNPWDARLDMADAQVAPAAPVASISPTPPPVPTAPVASISPAPPPAAVPADASDSHSTTGRHSVRRRLSSVHMAAYERSMLMTALVELEGAFQSAGKLTALMSNEERGVAHQSLQLLPVGAFQGRHTFDLVVYSDHDGGEARFLFEHIDGTVHDIDRTIAFADNAVHGSPTDPIRLVALPAPSPPPPSPPPAVSCDVAPACNLSADQAEQRCTCRYVWADPTEGASSPCPSVELVCLKAAGDAISRRLLASLPASGPDALDEAAEHAASPPTFDQHAAVGSPSPLLPSSSPPSSIDHGDAIASLTTSMQRTCGVDPSSTDPTPPLCTTDASCTCYPPNLPACFDDLAAMDALAGARSVAAALNNGDDSLANELELSLHEAYARHQCMLRVLHEGDGHGDGGDGLQNAEGEGQTAKRSCRPPECFGDAGRGEAFYVEQMKQCDEHGTERVVNAALRWIWSNAPWMRQIRDKAERAEAMRKREDKLECLLLERGWCRGKAKRCDPSGQGRKATGTYAELADAWRSSTMDEHDYACTAEELVGSMRLMVDEGWAGQVGVCLWTSHNGNMRRGRQLITTYDAAVVYGLLGYEDHVAGCELPDNARATYPTRYDCYTPATVKSILQQIENTMNPALNKCGGYRELWWGITSNGEVGMRGRWYSKYSHLHHMTALWLSQDITPVLSFSKNDNAQKWRRGGDTKRRQLEMALIGETDRWENDNEDGGGSGNDGQVPYVVYAAWGH